MIARKQPQNQNGRPLVAPTNKFRQRICFLCRFRSNGANEKPPSASGGERTCGQVLSAERLRSARDVVTTVVGVSVYDKICACARAKRFSAVALTPSCLPPRCASCAASSLAEGALARIRRLLNGRKHIAKSQFIVFRILICGSVWLSKAPVYMSS